MLFDNHKYYFFKRWEYTTRNNSLFFLEMAHSIEKEATYCCFDLDEVIDFSQKTLIEKSNMVDEIFSKQMRLGSKIGCQAFREYFLRKVDKVHKTYKDQIVFLFKGKIDI